MCTSECRYTIGRARSCRRTDLCGPRRVFVAPDARAEPEPPANGQHSLLGLRHQQPRDGRRPHLQYGYNHRRTELSL